MAALPRCEGCPDPAIGHVLPCQHRTCGGCCLNDVCPECLALTRHEPCSHGHTITCGVSGCGKVVESISRDDLSRVQTIAIDKYEEMKQVVAFRNASTGLVEEWEGERASESDDGSDY